MRDIEPVTWLTEEELDDWRQLRASLDMAENTTVLDSDEWQRVRGFYYESYRLLAGFYDHHHLDRTRYLSINVATGSVLYEPIEVEVEME